MVIRDLIQRLKLFHIFTKEYEERNKEAVREEINESLEAEYLLSDLERMKKYEPVGNKKRV